MQSNLEQFKRKMSNFMRSGSKPTSGGLESPTNSGNDDERSSAVAAYEAALITQLREQAKGLPLNNPHKEREILESIDVSYYKDSDFDPSIYELMKLPNILNVNEIKEDRERKKNQLLVVSKKVSDLILHHHPSYSAELQKVTELQSTLSSAHSSCRSARKMIDGAQENFTVAGLTILGTYRKRQRLVAVLEALNRLKTLRETDQRLRELFEEENYIGAIMMCAECQRAAASFRQYRCISDLAKKLHDTMFVIEEQLDNALASTAIRVDLERYSRVVAAYEMIGKIKAAGDLLVSHFSKAINNAADTVVGKYKIGNVIPSGVGADASNVGGGEAIQPEQVVDCLRELLSIFWRIWLGYHAILLWHVERPVLTTSGTGTDEHGDSDYIETKLEQGLSHVWLESVRRLNPLIRNADLNVLKMDDFLTMIDLVNKMSLVGRRHFKSESVDLEETLREKSIEYFKFHHRHSLDELAMFLEMEAWEAVPVKRHFNYKDLPEYAFLIRSGVVDGGRRESARASLSEDSDRVSSWELMAEGSSATNPFETISDVGENDVLNGSHGGQLDSDDSDVPDELKQDYIDDAVAENNVQRPLFKRHESYKAVDSMQPILSNAALSLLRLWGRYLQAAFSLPSVAFDVVVLLGQLFDYYFLAIHRYFGSDAFDLGVEFKSTKLQQALRRIENTFPEIGKNIPPNRASGSILTYADRLFGLGPRIVAVESLVFVAQQLESLRPILERIVSSNKIAFISQFYSQTVSVASELRRSVYGAVASKSLNYSHFLNSVSSVNWEIGELMSQHSDYVDFLIRDLDNLRLRLSELARTVRIPKEAYVILWEFCIQIIAKLLVEGYSCARKCTNEGRALMQLDFQQLLLVMEKISNLRPLPHREYVESYIKAYYLPEASIEQWIMERKDYSTKQLIGLLNVATHVSKKTRQRLTPLLLGQPEDS